MTKPDPVRSEDVETMVADLCAKHDMTREQVLRLIGVPNRRPRIPAPNSGWYHGDPRSKGVAVKRRGRGRS